MDFSPNMLSNQNNYFEV